MAIVFIDSFDHYNTLLQKWSSGDAGFNTNLAFVRTGTQSLNPSGPGFADLPRINFSRRTTMIAGVWVYLTVLGPQCFKWFNSVDHDELGEIFTGNDGSISLGRNGFVLATSRPGVVQAGQGFYVESKATFTNPGTCEIRVNGVTEIAYVGDMAFPGFEFVDGFTLPGNDIFDVFYDDLYLLDDSGGVNNDFLGAVRIFAILPDANETPLNWTPLAGTNFSEVNQAPPPGDTAYVSDATPGDIDQYHYTITGPVGSYTIKGIQHSLSCRLDSAGAHTMASQINAHTGGVPEVGSNTPGATYDFVITPWDVNPNTGVAFVPADFATTFVGPKLTA